MFRNLIEKIYITLANLKNIHESDPALHTQYYTMIKHDYYHKMKDMVLKFLCAEIYVRLHLLLLFSIADVYISVI